MKNFKLLVFLQIVLLSTFLLQKVKSKPQPEDWEDDFFNNDNNDNHEHEGHTSEEVGPRALQTPHEHPEPPSSASAQEPGKGFSGGNVANYNESCGMTISCNNMNNLKCVEGKCACQEGHTYIRYQEKCYPIFANAQQKCEFDLQCHDGHPGQLSRCNHISGKCECHDTFSSGKNTVVMYQGTCVYRKNRNDTCQKDAECQSTMKSNSYCGPDPQGGMNGAVPVEICQCLTAFVWDPLQQECYKIAEGPNSDCKSDYPCKASPMKELARCSPDTRKCECYDAKNPGPDNARYYPKTGECFEKKFWNATCDHHDQCKASLHANAECLPQQSEEGSVAGTQLLVCQCPTGRKCSSAGTSSVPTVAAIVFHTILLSLMSIYVFY